MVSLRRRRNAAIAAAAAAAAEEAAAAAAVAAAAAEEAAALIQRNEVLHQIKRLRQIQKELDKVKKEERDEILEIKKNCIGKRRPMYARRNQIIKEIPCFWLTAFMNNSKLANLLQEEDQKVFSYLDSVNVEDFSDPRMGYCIRFRFRDNPFFYNRNLSKTVSIFADGAVRSYDTPILWKGVKGLANVNDRRQPLLSFFAWFCSPGDDEVEDKQLSVAKIIKEEFWPTPILDSHLLTMLDDEVDFDEDEDI